MDTCPRRIWEIGPWKRDAGQDRYRENGKCSFCGSLAPEEVFNRIEAGEMVTPTDKSYKIYITPHHGKFYFQHFDDKQKQKFIDLINKKKINLDYPGHFYVLPYFCKYA